MWKFLPLPFFNLKMQICWIVVLIFEIMNTSAFGNSSGSILSYFIPLKTMLPRRAPEDAGEILAQDENLRNPDEVLALDSGPWNKSDKFVADQKSAEKRPTVVLTQRQKNKKARKLGYVRATYFPINSQSVLHVVISI